MRQSASRNQRNRDPMRTVSARVPRLPAVSPYAPLRRPAAPPERRRRLKPDSSRSFDEFTRSAPRRGPPCRQPEPAGAGRLYIRNLCQRAVVVLGAAAVHQNSAAAARRLARGMVGGDGVLSVAAARWLRLCALPDAGEEPHDSGAGASGAAGDRARNAAAVDQKRLGRAAEFGLCVLAARAVRGLDRIAVLCARGQQPTAASLVRSHRSPQWSRSVFSLCLLEYRQLPGAVVLSGAAGADVHAAHAKLDLERWLWAADRADRGLWGAVAARAGVRGGRRVGRRFRGTRAGLDVALALDIPGRGALGPAYRGDRAYLHRRGRRAAVMGAAAVALPPDLGAGVPVTPAAAAQMDIDAAAAGDSGRGRAARDRWRTEPAADGRRASTVFLCHRDGLPRRVGAHPPGGEISHRLLCGVVVRRHARRVVRGIAGAVHLLVGRRIPDPAGAGGAVPAAEGGTLAALESLVLAVHCRALGGPDRAVLVH